MRHWQFLAPRASGEFQKASAAALSHHSETTIDAPSSPYLPAAALPARGSRNAPRFSIRAAAPGPKSAMNPARSWTWVVTISQAVMANSPEISLNGSFAHIIARNRSGRKRPQVRHSMAALLTTKKSAWGASAPAMSAAPLRLPPTDTLCSAAIRPDISSIYGRVGVAEPRLTGGTRVVDRGQS